MRDNRTPTDVCGEAMIEYDVKKYIYEKLLLLNIKDLKETRCFNNLIIPCYSESICQWACLGDLIYSK